MKLFLVKLFYVTAGKGHELTVRGIPAYENDKDMTLEVHAKKKQKEGLMVKIQIFCRDGGAGGVAKVVLASVLGALLCCRR